VATESDGWKTECFAPTWFAFDGETLARGKAATRIGSDGAAILSELGYSPEDVRKLVAEGAVGRTEWAKG